MTKHLVTSSADLPHLDAEVLYLDFETTSGDPCKRSVNPWRDCRPLGLAVTSEEAASGEHAWYLPMRHRGFTNLDPAVVADWMVDHLSRATRWENANVKYHTYKKDVKLGPGQTLKYKTGKGYYAG